MDLLRLIYKVNWRAVSNDRVVESVTCNMQSEGDSSLPLPRAWVAARVRAVRSRSPRSRDATDVLFFRSRAGRIRRQ